MLTTRTPFRTRRSGAILFGTQTRTPRRAFGGWITGSSTPEAAKKTPRSAR